MLRCQSCGNQEEFVSEAWVLHWVSIDGEGRINQIEDMEDAGAYVKTETSPYIECAVCMSTDVTMENSVIRGA